MRIKLHRRFESFYLRQYNLWKRIMEFYFGKANPEEYKDLPKGELFSHDGHYFWYKLEISEEGICFHDTCNRHMPFDRDSLKELEVAVYIAREHDLARRDGERARHSRIERLAKTLAAWQAQER